MAQKETILGNYLGFARFPLDCESIEYLQANTQLLAVIARLSGCDKLILSGCDGDPRKEGYVYIRTGNDLVGEVVYFKGGTGTRCKIVPTDFDVTANGERFENAYTKRVLESSSSPSDMAWGDFAKLSDISNAALKAAVDGKAAASHTHAISNVTGLQAALDGKAAASHTHPIGNIIGLQAALDGKAASTHTHNYSAPGHGHSISDVSGLQSALDGKAASSHTHNYSAPGHTHDDRYYTESEIDAKLAVGTDDHQPRIFIRKYGRVVTISFIGSSVSNNKYYQWTGCIPYDYRPAVNYNGVGFGYLGSEMDDYPPSSNMIAFRIDTNGTLTIGKNTTSTNFEGSATYISAR